VRGCRRSVEAHSDEDILGAREGIGSGLSHEDTIRFHTQTESASYSRGNEGVEVRMQKGLTASEFDSLQPQRARFLYGSLEQLGIKGLSGAKFRVVGRRQPTVAACHVAALGQVEVELR
jgi:hypothetical protein